MDEAEADVLAYMAFPTAHRTKLHSTNPIERLNGEKQAAHRSRRHFSPTKPRSPA
jgi:transposase-like protein